jgi:hypothetical protein
VAVAGEPEGRLGCILLNSSYCSQPQQALAAQSELPIFGPRYTCAQLRLGDLASEPLHRIIFRIGNGDRTMARGTVKWFNSQKGYGFI